MGEQQQLKPCGPSERVFRMVVDAHGLPIVGLRHDVTNDFFGMANVVFAAMLYEKSRLDTDREALFRLLDASTVPEHGLPVSDLEAVAAGIGPTQLPVPEGRLSAPHTFTPGDEQDPDICIVCGGYASEHREGRLKDKGPKFRLLTDAEEAHLQHLDNPDERLSDG